MVTIIAELAFLLTECKLDVWNDDLMYHETWLTVLCFRKVMQLELAAIHDNNGKLRLS